MSEVADGHAVFGSAGVALAIEEFGFESCVQKLTAQASPLDPLADPSRWAQRAVIAAWGVEGLRCADKCDWTNSKHINHG